MSSLFAALNVSVAGLGAQSQAIGNISDDLSNAETTGFKSIGTSFEDLVTASNSTNNSPGGVTATPQYQNDVQGTLTASSTVTNLAISGGGFFPVETAVQTTTGATAFTGNTFYTRAGDFTQDKSGFLVNGGGYYLLGYPIAGGVTQSSSTQPIQISALLNDPVPTAVVTYAANLPSNAVANYTAAASDINVFDALGNEHQMSLVWNNTGTNTWNVLVTVQDGLGVGVPYQTNIPVTFNSVTNIGTIASITPGGGPNAYTVDPSATNADVILDNGGGGLTFNGAGSQSIELNFGTYNAASGVTQFSDPSQLVSVSSFQQDGLPKGSFNSININNSGIVSINYSNGSARDIYQIPLASFNSPDNLQRVTGGAYEATLAAGAANLYLPGTNGAGTIASGSLESSNVDIATEFTDLITAQQVYAANAKSVTTVNSMLTTIINAVQ